MSDLADFKTALRAVADPHTPTSDLATIASFHKQLRPNVICHPQATRALLDWIASSHDVRAFQDTVASQAASVR